MLINCTAHNSILRQEKMQPQMTTALYDYEGAVLLIIYSYRGGHVTSLVCPFVGWICLKIPLAVGPGLALR